MLDQSLYIICSGDTDAVVPITATRYSVDALKLETITNWYPWYDHGKVKIGTFSCEYLCIVFRQILI